MAGWGACRTSWRRAGGAGAGRCAAERMEALEERAARQRLTGAGVDELEQ